MPIRGLHRVSPDVILSASSLHVRDNLTTYCPARGPPSFSGAKSSRKAIFQFAGMPKCPLTVLDHMVSPHPDGGEVAQQVGGQTASLLPPLAV